jgi:hypothetical protein
MMVLVLVLLVLLVLVLGLVVLPPCIGGHVLSALLQAASSGACLADASELSAYLDSDTVNQYDNDFNILNWWHEQKLPYPVLSILEREVMIVPVSTILSESAFNTTSGIIEER